jgi:hypothetical protein
MRSRCKSNKQQARLRIAKTRVWLSPVVLVIEAPDFFACNFLAPADKARTETASNNLVLKITQRRQERKGKFSENVALIFEQIG